MDTDFDMFQGLSGHFEDSILDDEVLGNSTLPRGWHCS